MICAVPGPRLQAHLAVLELVDAVRARHVTPDVSIYCTVVAEPYINHRFS